MQPDGSRLFSSSTTTLPLQSLSVPALTAHVVPDLTTPLLFIGQLCDNDCAAVFTKDKALIIRGSGTSEWLQSIPANDIIMTGDRDGTDSLWHLPLHMTDTQPTHSPIPEGQTILGDQGTSINNCFTLRPNSTIKQRVRYYHACLGSPTLSTWTNAIEAGHLTSFPTLTTSQVRKYFPHSIATYMGHLDQTPQARYSTKIRPHYSRDLYIGIVEDIETPTIPHRPGTLYSDPTGRFITTSSQGNNYILVVF